jgi:DNA adenine methylase
VYREGKIRQAFLSDLNAELIDTYIAIRAHVEDIIRILSGFPHDRNFYYELRA